jgi:hypothetical protein
MAYDHPRLADHKFGKQEKFASLSKIFRNQNLSLDIKKSVNRYEEIPQLVGDCCLFL